MGTIVSINGINGMLMTNFMARPRKTTLSLPAMANSKVNSVAVVHSGKMRQPSVSDNKSK